ncbi:uncharacterized protein LOC131989238 [Centropristis striata]|uniref:uncharacterized protein LOC131989238 n=1 Tax=Centropristis striata TaxID=184440 RepID=UPI0027DF84A1|nr:uncharacterized protein LOC131989238 [Centropristis striata]
MTDLKWSSSVRQELRFVSANVGDKVTLQCFYEGDGAAWLFWYKQTLGHKPKLISSKYTFDIKSSFSHEFKNNPRFTLDTKNSAYDLNISDLQISDSATYFCATGSSFNFKFAEGTIIHVKGSGLNVPAFIHQSASETVQPGGSVTLNCTVHTGTCEGEHSVYWFKNSEESPPGLIYTHGGMNDQCDRKTKTQTCVYNLPMKSLNPSHAGTYYCAVVSCGHILFGDGTKLDFEGEADLVYFLSPALIFTTILSVLLAFTVCMTNKDSCKSTESRATFPTPSTANPKDFQHAEKVYNGFSVNLHNRSGRLKDPTWSECVYNSVKK